MPPRTTLPPPVQSDPGRCEDAQASPELRCPHRQHERRGPTRRAPSRLLPGTRHRRGGDDRGRAGAGPPDRGAHPRQLPPRRRRRDPALSPDHRRLPRARRGDDPAALPRRRPRRLRPLLPAELVAVGPALDARPGRQPCDDPPGDRGADRGLRAGRAPGEGGGLRRLRDHGRVQRAVRAVLVALQQPPGRRLRRLVREPHALLVTDACEDPRAVRRGLRDRGVRERRPDPARRALGRGPAGHRGVARRAWPLRLRDGGHRQLLRVHPPDAHLRLRGQARSALCRADQAGGAAREGAVGEPYPHPGERGRGNRRRAGGHGEHRARPDRGPAHGEQGTRGAGRGRAPLPLVQPDVLGDGARATTG